MQKIQTPQNSYPPKIGKASILELAPEFNLIPVAGINFWNAIRLKRAAIGPKWRNFP
jgi:hypothetical protein